MSVSAALWAITWIAMLVLLFALAAVMRELRLLRGQVQQLGWREVEPRMPGDVRLAPDVVSGRRRLVLAASSGCPLCQMFAHHLAEGADRFADAPVLLTYESPEQWAHLPAGLDVVSDDTSWRAVAHLSPPVLMLVDPDGSARELAMPTSLNDLESTLAAWNLPAADTTKDLR